MQNIFQLEQGKRLCFGIEILDVRQKLQRGIFAYVRHRNST